ncbi:MAG TPA: type II toxin-antitoxin system VapC family toxin [Verrucomicrobiae bacterium]|nr:type II toxin-antitoxin system VapC family toxin [Verrucomicrobiae bacterium]
MRTAVDSSVLWAILNAEPGWEAWVAVLQTAAAEGELLVCPIVFAEVAPSVSSADELLSILHGLGVAYDPLLPGAAFLAGQTFRKYRDTGGPRDRMIPDFLVAAHAQHQADRLAATDRGYLRRYFPKLALLAPGD